MTVTPTVADRVLYRMTGLGGKLWAADVLEVLPPVLGIQHVRLQVWTVWPLGEDDPSIEVADSAQALDIIGIVLLVGGTWRSITEIPNWRSYVGT